MNREFRHMRGRGKERVEDLIVSIDSLASENSRSMKVQRRRIREVNCGVYGSDLKITELIQGLFHGLDKDLHGQVHCTDLIETLISLGVTVDQTCQSAALRRILFDMAAVDPALSASVNITLGVFKIFETNQNGRSENQLRRVLFNDILR